MKKNIFISLGFLILSIVLSEYVLSKPLANLYLRFFNYPDFLGWGSPLFVTWPLSYGFCIVFLFTLWNIKNYYYPMILFLSPFLLLFLNSDFKNILIGILYLILVVWLPAFLLAKLINLIISKIKRPQLR